MGTCSFERNVEEAGEEDVEWEEWRRKAHLIVSSCADDEDGPRNRKSGRNSQQVGSGGHPTLGVGRG